MYVFESELVDAIMIGDIGKTLRLIGAGLDVNELLDLEEEVGVLWLILSDARNSKITHSVQDL